MGMSLKEYDEETRELAFHFFVAPAIILIGMFTVGTIIDTFVNTNGTVPLIFLGVGGTPGVIAYYVRLLKKRGWIGTKND